MKITDHLKCFSFGSGILMGLESMTQNLGHDVFFLGLLEALINAPEAISAMLMFSYLWMGMCIWIWGYMAFVLTEKWKMTAEHRTWLAQKKKERVDQSGQPHQTAGVAATSGTSEGFEMIKDLLRAPTVLAFFVGLTSALGIISAKEAIDWGSASVVQMGLWWLGFTGCAILFKGMRLAQEMLEHQLVERAAAKTRLGLQHPIQAQITDQTTSFTVSGEGAQDQEQGQEHSDLESSSQTHLPSVLPPVFKETCLEATSGSQKNSDLKMAPCEKQGLPHLNSKWMGEKKTDSNDSASKRLFHWTSWAVVWMICVILNSGLWGLTQSPEAIALKKSLLYEQLRTGIEKHQMNQMRQDQEHRRS